MLPAPDAKVSYLDDAYRVSRDIRQDARRIIQKKAELIDFLEQEEREDKENHLNPDKNIEY